MQKEIEIIQRHAKELKKLEKDSDNKGLTIVPLKLYTNEKGFAKVEIALCRGKKNYGMIGWV